MKGCQDMSIRGKIREKKRLERRVQLARTQDRFRKLDTRYTLNDMMIRIAEKTHRDIEINLTKDRGTPYFGA
jgi:hypothetical protein